MSEIEKSRGEIGAIAGVPKYLLRRPQMFVRRGHQIVEAPDEDRIVAQSYPAAAVKGPLTDGRRLTLLTKKATYRVGEDIRVIHVVEITEPGHSVYVAGPKEIHGEYVDGHLATKALPRNQQALVPAMYDGPVLQSPAVDYNYEITEYSFKRSGLHEIYWELGPLRSNVLEIEVVQDAEAT